MITVTVSGPQGSGKTSSIIPKIVESLSGYRFPYTKKHLKVVWYEDDFVLSKSENKRLETMGVDVLVLERST